ncbi:metal ABC transporter permease [Corynebacterium sp. ES2794-CONJ1]|uniref:metal ABC transporter permease n=1 Tax=unclassified Corynebacterium TaxID=2624378 RepID=UPI0021681291|nr:MULTISPECIES: metal ABC transporter permease [unclassified Corynebacterium]MCS4490157.1 metal ABC transporter permease [Corynebacterium sp. ES2775-CONJ]MCS4492031.1 metal ABC transporter permease [Corynebacterium sp. ES2715-CONJ3]MCS4532136.1 metal ABC transporter permease [Corynebacterium sp. ES2730-CONJ]MCU9519538.1 metal ABC transporter permease [Corynebacterium sp. ES2794-CONJ1]
MITTEQLIDIFTVPYLYRALIVLVILGIIGGIVGVLVNLRAVEFSVEALVHSIFPGMVAGLAIGGIEGIIPGAALVAALAAFMLTLTTKRQAPEAGTAVVLTSFYGIGVVMSLAIGDYSGQLDSLMFGRLLDITPTRMNQALVCAIIALTLVLITWRQQVLVAFDRTFAEANKHKTSLIDACLNAAIAACVVAASSAVGVLLVIGYLVIPGSAARLLCRTPRSMVVVAMASGIIAAFIGVIVMNLNLSRQVSPQAAVSLSLIVVFVLALVVAALRSRLSPGTKRTFHSRGSLADA